MHHLSVFFEGKIIMENKQLYQLDKAITDFRKGNRHALLTIYDATCSTVNLYASCFFSSEHSVQKFITRIYQEISKQRDRIPDADVLSTWIADLCFQTYFRLLDRKGEYIDISQMIYDSAKKPRFEEPSASIRDFDKETSAIIGAHLLEQLPSFSRVVLYAYYIDNLYIAAIAHALGEKTSTIEQLVYSSVNQLQTLYHQKEAIERNLFYPFTLPLYLEILSIFKNSFLLSSAKKTEIKMSLCRLLSLDMTKSKLVKPFWMRSALTVSAFFSCGILLMFAILFLFKKPKEQPKTADLSQKDSYALSSPGAITEDISSSDGGEAGVSLLLQTPDDTGDDIYETDDTPEETSPSGIRVPQTASTPSTGSSLSSSPQTDASGTTNQPVTNSPTVTAPSVPETPSPAAPSQDSSHAPSEHTPEAPEVPQPNTPAPPEEPTISVPAPEKSAKEPELTADE